MTGKVELIRHISLEELDELIKNERDSKVLRKLSFIRLLYKGESIIKACDLIGICRKTGYNYLHRWNDEGFEGLLSKCRYNKGKSKLTDEQKDILKKILSEKDFWTSNEVQKIIKDKFNVEYSQRHICRILKSFGMKYAKSYIKDKRRPDNAEEILKKT